MTILKAGTIHNDTFYETANNLILWTGGGSDTIYYSGWDGIIDAGEGGDRISIENGSADVYGGGDLDWINLNNAYGHIDAGAGGCFITASNSTAGLSCDGVGGNFIDAYNGTYWINADVSALVTVYNSNVNICTGGSAYLNRLEGTSLKIGGSNFIVQTGANSDFIKFDQSSGSAELGPGGDDISASSGYYIIDAGDDQDSVFISASDGSLVFGGAGNDLLVVQSGNCSLYGGDGDDRLASWAGASLLDGGAGDDTLIVGTGDATLKGGAGADIMTGGGGAQTFLYDALDGSIDQINWFTRGEDHLAFTAASLGVAAGTPFQANMFALDAAVGAQAQFVFDTASSTLYFDSDGNGSAPGVTVAQMVGLTTMSAADFRIV